ncbi:AbrB/MazE/SpoVT family DNA-binding domain-containing protein [Alicyclobacillus fastidiosus]|uniref:AbrB/MazE/SpoVT family DNA-binding domain-containing protein n=1 Tax=Alicyclobacillus fastidiosus TaxID=392011 RepID=A0ABY6ZQ63_9BACL|nr:AbrB/MazE/SpoVT family DNA-binding domain-containing protein [Alicyclobacillus fastidiosus]WAH44090.1 AbrB/MazE/SpoVT family DNA-binding domain-containing protein [Alicyclobacillus fastidiosus]GMA60383.1 AbrB family transcriptional regulator [Alicyclobacillus fastidiosus]
MKATGIVRKIDELGRVVMPMELRRTLGIDNRDSMGIFVDGDRIILRKYESSCTFCNSADNLTTFKEKRVCGDCCRELKEALV